MEFGYGTGQKGTGRLLPDIIRDDSLGRKGGSGRLDGVWDTYRGIEVYKLFCCDDREL